jgi:hypothetical protein
MLMITAKCKNAETKFWPAEAVPTQDMFTFVVEEGFQWMPQTPTCCIKSKRKQQRQFIRQSTARAQSTMVMMTWWWHDDGGVPMQLLMLVVVLMRLLLLLLHTVSDVRDAHDRDWLHGGA